MAPKPIWGTISSYFYPVETEEVVAAPVVSEQDNVDEDGWMLVGPKRVPSPDTDEVQFTFFYIFTLQLAHST